MKSFKNYESRGGYSGESDGSVAELTKKLADAFNGQPTGAMLKSILREAEEKKRAGLLTNDEIDFFFEQFSPMLDPSQRATLKNVVERLKKI